VTTNRIDALTEGLLKAEPVSVARLISWAENRDPRIEEVLRRVYPRTGQAYRLGITGPPGGGKSTLIAKLAVTFRDRGERVAVVAVDPTSPFSGGALLGDRYRMLDLVADPGIFIRSMATRGSQGGLASATVDALDLLDAAGFTMVLVETVGVGQVELDIAETSDTVVVVLVPESGDSIQAMKAGLMEIADLFVVNKADREGADRLAQALESMLDLHARGDRPRPEVLTAAAAKGAGIEEIADAATRHRRGLEAAGDLERRRRRTMKQRLLGEARRALVARFEGGDGEALEELLDRVARRETTPHDAAREMMAAIEGRGTPPARKD
jgi:LAO/AO transport system kinase